MIVSYPLSATTEASNLSVCYRLDEQLREEHNAFGDLYRAGQLVDTGIDAFYNEALWMDYQRYIFMPKSKAIHFEIGKQIELASKSIYWDVAIDVNVATDPIIYPWYSKVLQRIRDIAKLEVI